MSNTTAGGQAGYYARVGVPVSYLPIFREIVADTGDRLFAAHVVRQMRLASYSRAVSHPARREVGRRPTNGLKNTSTFVGCPETVNSAPFSYDVAGRQAERTS